MNNIKKTLLPHLRQKQNISYNNDFGERYYIHSIVIASILFLFYVFGLNNNFLTSSILEYQNIESDAFDGTVYPIEFIPNPIEISRQERMKDYSLIDSKYFIRTPIYNPDIFGKDENQFTNGSKEYNEIVIQKSVYTTPYMGTYNLDYKENVGSHVGIDMAVPGGTPVRAIANGVVVEVKSVPSGFGNYVYIKHNNIDLNGEKTTIYSLYAHLDRSIVKPGEKIKKADVLGYVGRTGIATGNHLHFQIDIEGAPFQPYWPFVTEDIKKLGLTFFEGVSQGVGKENGYKYTINSLKFVNSHLSPDGTNVLFIKDDNKVDNSKYVSGNNIDQLIDKENKKDNILEEVATEKFDKEVFDNKVSLGSNKNDDEIIDYDKYIDNNEGNKDINDTQENKKVEDINDTEENKKAEDINDTEENKKAEDINDTEENIKIDNNEGNKDINDTQENKKAEDINDTQENKKLEDINDTQENKKVEDINDTEENKKAEDINDTEENIKIDDKEKIFEDIDKNNYFYKEIKFFKDNGVIYGFEDNTFRPKKNISRIEALKIILLANNIELTNNGKNNIDDVENDSWESYYVNTGILKGIINNDTENFRPLKNITRIESLKMILLLLNISLDKYYYNNNIDDIPNDSWYITYVNYALKNNLLGLNDNKFFPNNLLTRGDLVKVLYKMIHK